MRRNKVTLKFELEEGLLSVFVLSNDVFALIVIKLNVSAIQVCVVQMQQLKNRCS